MISREVHDDRQARLLFLEGDLRRLHNLVGAAVEQAVGLKDARPTLAEAGIDKHLAGRNLTKIPLDEDVYREVMYP